MVAVNPDAAQAVLVDSIKICVYIPNNRGNRTQAWLSARAYLETRGLDPDNVFITTDEKNSLSFEPKMGQCRFPPFRIPPRSWKKIR